MLIYKAINRENQRSYVGQTSLSLEDRKKQHFYTYGKRPSYFHLAIRKYGLESFDWEIVAICDTKDKADFLEKFYIVLFNTRYPTGYNFAEGGQGGSFLKTEEHRKKIRESNIGKKHIAHTLNGLRLSEGTKRKISESRLKRKEELGYINSSETRIKIGLAGKGRISNRLGVHLSEQTKQKLREHHAGGPQKGYHHTEESKMLIRQRTKEAMQKPEIREKYLNGIARRDNKVIERTYKEK